MGLDELIIIGQPGNYGEFFLETNMFHAPNEDFTKLELDTQAL